LGDDIDNLVLAQEVVSRLEVVRDPVLLHLEGEDLTFTGDVDETLVELLEAGAHESNEVIFIDKFSIFAQKLIIDIFHELLQKRLFYLNGGSNSTAQLIHHKFEFAFLHILLFIITKKLKNH
jgi:hypothetical protein